MFKQAIAKITPHIENCGIDEIYIDLSEHPEETVSLASRIKQAVRNATGLSCSIGIAPNKLLAKIASDLDKPDGLTILTQADVPERLWPLPVRKINGIGPKAEKKLAGLGIRKIGELANAELGLLRVHFGRSNAIRLHDAAHGRDNRPVVTSSKPKSISREATFERDLHVREDREMLSEIFSGLCLRVAEDLRRKKYVGRTIGIKLRYEDFQTVTRDLTVRNPTADAVTIRKAAGECLRRVSFEQKLRLLGIRISGLSKTSTSSKKDSYFQEELFLQSEQ